MLRKAISSESRDPYAILGNNCGHFTYDVLEAGGVTNMPSFVFNPTPVNQIDELIEEGHDSITWTPEDGTSRDE